MTRPDEALRWFERAFRQFKRAADATGMACACCGAMEAILLDWKEFGRLDRWIVALDRLFDPWSRTAPAGLVLRAAADMFGSLLWRRPYVPRIEAWAHRARELMDRVEDSGLCEMSLSHLFCYHIWKGDLAEAERLGNWKANRASESALSPVWAINHTLFQGVLCWHTGRYTECAAVVTKALAQAADTGVHVMDHHVLSQGVYAALLSGDLERAQVDLSRLAAARPPGNDFVSGHHQYLAGWAAWLMGRDAEAWQCLNGAYRAAARAGSPFPMAINHYARALLVGDRGHHPQAVCQLGRALRIGRRMKSTSVESMCLLARAFVRLDGPESAGSSSRAGVPSSRIGHRRALDDLARGLALARDIDMAGYAWWNPRIMSRLCAVALEAGIEGSYVRRLIRRMRLTPPESALHLIEWPWPVRIFTLGRFGLTVDGRTLAHGRKTQKKPLELIQAVIAFGGRNVHEDRLADALWPELEGPAALDALHIALRRARALLGSQEALRRQGNCLTLEARWCWVDAWAFERLLSQTGATASSLDSALAWYQGGFLAGNPSMPWAEAMRERLRRKFLTAIVRRAQRKEQDGAWEQAAQDYERGWVEDPVSEDLCRRLMVCYHRLGRLADIQALYRRYCAACASLDGTSPSPELAALAQKLRSR